MPKPDPFKTLLEPQLPALYRFAWRLAGNRPDAEDLVQDVCALACRNLATLAATERPAHWLMRVLYNRFVDGARRQARSPVVAFDPGQDEVACAGPAADPAAAAEQRERERAVLQACAMLSDSHRALLSLRAEGYGLTEIEHITGVSRQVLRARLHRARLSLARHLDEQTEETERETRLGSKP